MSDESVIDGEPSATPPQIPADPSPLGAFELLLQPEIAADSPAEPPAEPPAAPSVASAPTASPPAEPLDYLAAPPPTVPSASDSAPAPAAVSAPAAPLAPLQPLVPVGGEAALPTVAAQGPFLTVPDWDAIDAATSAPAPAPVAEPLPYPMQGSPAEPPTFTPSAFPPAEFTPTAFPPDAVPPESIPAESFSPAIEIPQVTELPTAEAFPPSHELPSAPEPSPARQVPTPSPFPLTPEIPATGLTAATEPPDSADDPTAVDVATPDTAALDRVSPEALSPESVTSAAPSVAVEPPDPSSASGIDAAFPFPELNPSDSTASTTNFGLERRTPAPAPKTGIFDWVSLALAIVVAPVGLLAGIGALVLSWRRNGWTSGVARAAVIVGAVLTAGLIVAGLVFANIQQKQNAYQAIITSSKQFCSEVRADPTTLSSPTYNWPAQADTIEESLVTMKAYVAKWTGIAKSAPAGVKPGVQKIVTASTGIVNSISSSGTMDDESDQSLMTQAVQASGVAGWVANYCK